MGVSGSTVSRTTFVRDLSGVAIDPSSAPLARALTAAGVDPAQLTAIAGKDGKISGSTELGKLYGLVDGFDKNGSGTSFQARDAGGTLTTSGAAHEALKTEVASLRALANASPTGAQLNKNLGVGTAKNPAIDTHAMSPELTGALSKAGVSEADFKAAAGPDGRFTSKGDYARLHGLLDRADGAVDGKATGKTRDATTGALSDTPVGALTTALGNETTRNAALPENAQPGTKSAPTQPALTVAADATTVDAKDQKPVSVTVPYINQFSLYPDDPAKGGKACFEAATKQTTQSLATSKTAGKLAGADEAIQVAYAEDGNGRTATNPTQARVAREYIDTQLDKGRPAMVGVSYSDDAYNTDKMTDHFITISGRGYDADGKVYYTFKDPGAGGAYAEGKLYVDQATGKLFKEGDKKGGYVQNADYEVTQVRTYTD